jgi:hypothetical protein
MKEEKVVLVDTEDNPVGTMPKMEAHEKAVLHRAFSVFILNKTDAATARFAQIPFSGSVDQHLLQPPTGR